MGGRLLSPVTPGATPAVTSATPPSFVAYLLSFLLFSSVLLTGEAYVVRWNNNTLFIPKYLRDFDSADGHSLAAAKDASRFVTTSTAVPSRFEVHQSDFRGNKGVLHHGRILDEQQATKHHNQHPQHDVSHPSPDFERQLEELKENSSSTANPIKPLSPPVNDEEIPISPQSRKDGLFTPGLGVEEVSFLGPIRRPVEGDEDKDDELTEARPLDLPLQPDLLESEADVLEELRKLNGRHDAPDPLLQDLTVLQTTPPPSPAKSEEARKIGIQEGTGDHFGEEEEDNTDDDDEDDEDDEDSDGGKAGGEEPEDEEDEDDDEDGDEEGEEEVTRDPEGDVASLEERLSASLRELAERRRHSRKPKFASAGEYVPASAPGEYPSHSAPERPATGPASSTGFSGPGTAPETASGSAPGTAPGTSGDTLPGTYPRPPRTDPFGAEDLTSSAPISSPESVAAYGQNVEKGDEDTRTIMKKAHMARKLMDPEDPKKDEDLLELMLRIAENPDEWKRVHHLLRQLDDDLTTYENTMHRVEALAMEKSSGKGGDKEGRRKKPGDKGEDDPERRRQEMSKSGLPAGSHGEELPSTTTTQLPLHPSVVGTSATTHHGNHKDWPRFAYHRVTTAPHPDLFLQQHENQKEGQGSAPSSSHPGNLHRNAYIAVSIITPPKGRHGGSSRPIPSPPPVYAVSPTPPESSYDTSQLDSSQIPTILAPPESRTKFMEGERIVEETLREPMAEEDIVDNVAREAARGRHHKVHGDPVEEQLRTLAAVEEKLRHHLHEKERMRHLLQEAGKGGDGIKHHRRERSTPKSTNVRHHHQHGLIASKTS